MTGSRPGADPPGSFVDEFNSVLYRIALLLHPEERPPERLQAVLSTLHRLEDRVDELGLEDEVQEQVGCSLAAALRELGFISSWVTTWLGSTSSTPRIPSAPFLRPWIDGTAVPMQPGEPPMRAR